MMMLVSEKKERTFEMLTGNDAVAQAVIMSRPDVIAAYPITPATAIVERLNRAVAMGELDAEFVDVESEHSAMAAVIGASVSGGRAFTATAAQGLLYMAENVFWAGYGRLPIVMAVVNRALAPGWTIWVDHQDTMAMRDAGWGQIYVKNNQEAYDSVIQAFKIAENHDVYFPFMVCLDGFVLSHVAAKVDLLSQEEVDGFLPPFDPLIAIHPSDPFAFGTLVAPNDYIELRTNLQLAMNDAKTVIKKVNDEWKQLTGRDYGGLVEHRGELDGDLCIVAMSTLAEEAEVAAEALTRKGIRTGVARVRVFRPFPWEDLEKIVAKYDKVIVIDRAVSFGHAGPLYLEVAAMMKAHHPDIPLLRTVMGLGGQDVHYTDIVARIEEKLDNPREEVF